MEITLEWFFKVPGLFITGGFLLILIALLVFFISSGKNKEENLDIDSNKKDDRIILNQENSDASNNQEEITFPKLDENEKPLMPPVDNPEFTVTDGLVKNTESTNEPVEFDNSYEEGPTFKETEFPKVDVQEFAVNNDIITPVNPEPVEFNNSYEEGPTFKEPEFPKADVQEFAVNNDIVTPINPEPVEFKPISFENVGVSNEINNEQKIVESNINSMDINKDEIVFPKDNFEPVTPKPIEIEPVTVFPTSDTVANTNTETGEKEEIIEEI